MPLLGTYQALERRVTARVAPDLFVLITGSSLLAHFFISIGRDELFWELWSTSWYAQELLIVWGITLTVVLTLRAALLWLERTFPWASGRIRRFMLQVLLCVLLPTAISVTLLWAYLIGVHGQHLAEGTFLSVELPVLILVLGAINITYMYWLREKSIIGPPVVPAVSAPPTVQRTLILSSGMRNVVVPVETVRWISKEGELAVVHVADGSRFVCTDSLDGLQEKLGNEELFFRANRQNIVNRDSCGSFRSHRSGKIDLILALGGAPELSISQKRAPAFRVWLKQGA